MDQLSHFLTQGHCLLVLVNDLVTRWLASTQAPSPTKLRFTWLNGHQTNELGSAYFQPRPTMASNWLRRVLALSNLSSPPQKKLTIFCGTHIISIDSMVMSCLTSQKTKKVLIKSFLTWDHIFFSKLNSNLKPFTCIEKKQNKILLVGFPYTIVDPGTTVKQSVNSQINLPVSEQ